MMMVDFSFRLSCGIRAGTVRELTRFSRSKFKMVWHQFSTVQFPSHQFVWEVRSVQFRACGRSASVQFSSGSVKSIEPPVVWEEQRNSSRPPPADIPAIRPVLCRLGGGMVRFAGCACSLVRDVFWCQSDANSV